MQILPRTSYYVFAVKITTTQLFPNAQYKSTQVSATGKRKNKQAVTFIVLKVEEDFFFRNVGKYLPVNKCVTSRKTEIFIVHEVEKSRRIRRYSAKKKVKHGK
jgi:hypothetical protein